MLSCVIIKDTITVQSNGQAYVHGGKHAGQMTLAYVPNVKSDRHSGSSLLGLYTDYFNEKAIY